MDSKDKIKIDELIDKINEYLHGGDVYIVGVTIVGKYTLINSLLKHYAEVPDNLITRIVFSGTTLDLI